MQKNVAQRLDQARQIDFINISLGTFHNLFLVEGSMHTPLAYTTPLSAGIRSVVNLPVYATNRINDPHLAEKILEDGQGDMINMVRALIADPELPNKARWGAIIRYPPLHCLQPGLYRPYGNGIYHRMYADALRGKRTTSW